MIQNRLNEPSTWAGVAALLQVLKAFFPLHALLIDGLTAAAGSVAVSLPERGGQHGLNP